MQIAAETMQTYDLYKFDTARSEADSTLFEIPPYYTTRSKATKKIE